MITQDDNKTYFAKEGINQSILKTWEACLKDNNSELFYTTLTKGTTPPVLSDSMLLGSAFDELMLEPNIFQKRMAHWDLSLTEKQREKLFKMQAIWNSTPLTKKLLKQIKDKEIQVQPCVYNTYKTQHGTINIKGKLDILSLKENKIIDVKTTFSIDSSYSFEKFKYITQAAFYVILMELEGQKINNFTFLFQETQDEYRMAELEIKGEVLDAAVQNLKQSLEDFALWAKNSQKKKINIINFDKKKLKEQYNRHIARKK